MFKMLVATLIASVSIQVSAMPNFLEEMVVSFQKSTLSNAETQGLNLVVGDTNEYDLDMGIIKGTMKMSVREEVAEGFWIDQDMDLKIQKVKVEILMDPNTGAILKLIVNGKEEQVPDSNIEIVEQKEAEVTVPAGTYRSIYLKIRDLDKNENSEVWINPQEIPINGMIKSIQPGQFGKVKINLKSSRRGK